MLIHAAAPVWGQAAAAGPVEVAPGTIFVWVDNSGVVHLTDSLPAVPEPFYSMYLAQLREQKAAPGNVNAGRGAEPVGRTPAPAAAGVAPGATASVVEQELARRQYWRGQVAYWRGELRSATAQLQEVDAQLTELEQNPVLRETPQVKAAAAEVRGGRERVQARVDKARQMLLKELPAEARRQQVPLRWLD